MNGNIGQRGGRAPRRAVFAAVALILAASAVWASVASATVMRYVDLARLVELSDVVVMGRVSAQTTEWNEQGQHPVTFTTFAIERTFLGVNLGETVTFRQWGGEFGDKKGQIPGDAVFQPHEEAIIFLDAGEGVDRGMYFLTALGQSKYTVVRGGEKTVVRRSLDDMVFLDPESKGIAGRPSETVELRSFLAELEATIAAVKGGSR